MAQLGYRPTAPSDVLGNIVVPLPETALDQERVAYAKRFKEEEDTDHYFAGCTDGMSLVAAVWTLEAFRLMNAGTFWGTDRPEGRELCPRCCAKQPTSMSGPWRQRPQGSRGHGDSGR